MSFIGNGILSGDDIGRDQIQHVDWVSGYVPSDKSLLTPLLIHDAYERALNL